MTTPEAWAYYARVPIRAEIAWEWRITQDREVAEKDPQRISLVVHVTSVYLSPPPQAPAEPYEAVLAECAAPRMPLILGSRPIIPSYLRCRCINWRPGYCCRFQ